MLNLETIEQMAEKSTSLSEAIAQFRTDQGNALAEAAKLERQAANIRAGITLPNLDQFKRNAEQRRTNAINQLIAEFKAWAFDIDSIRQFQMRAVGCHMRLSLPGAPHDLRDVLRQDGGSAMVAFILAGMLDRTPAKHLMPATPDKLSPFILYQLAEALGVGSGSVTEMKSAKAELDEIATFLGTCRSYAVSTSSPDPLSMADFKAVFGADGATRYKAFTEAKELNPAAYKHITSAFDLLHAPVAVEV